MSKVFKKFPNKILVHMKTFNQIYIRVLDHLLGVEKNLSVFFFRTVFSTLRSLRNEHVRLLIFNNFPWKILPTLPVYSILKNRYPRKQWQFFFAAWFSDIWKSFRLPFFVLLCSVIMICFASKNFKQTPLLQLFSSGQESDLQMFFWS